MVPTSSITPSIQPSFSPTFTPSAYPSISPSTTPSVMPTITPSIKPSVSPTIIPTQFPNLSPSTAPSSMPTSATSWLQIGNSINAKNDNDRFGYDLVLSADGNTVATSASKPGEAVRAFSFHNETNKWKQLGQDIKKDITDKFCLSPNGKFLGVALYLVEQCVGVVRVFALRQDKTKTNATSTPDADTDAVPMLWEQIGPDIVGPSCSSTDNSVESVSLTDDLVLAVGYIDKIIIYQIDKNQTAWVRMGKELQMSRRSMQLATAKSAYYREWVLAVGGHLTAKTYTYSSYTEFWSFEHEMVANDDSNTELGNVQLSLSVDGESIAVGLQKGHEISTLPISTLPIDYEKESSFFSTWCSLLRVFSYNVPSHEWIQLGKDLKADPSFLFGKFSLSANGKVLVTTTALQEKDSRNHTGASRVFGQVRTWDFIADNSGGNIGGGEWIQREAALEVGTWDTGFGWDIALSADGNRLAASAVDPYDQGIGKVYVFEQES